MKTFAFFERLRKALLSGSHTALFLAIICSVHSIPSTTFADVLNWPTNGWVELYGQESLFSDVPNDTGNNGHEYLDIVGDTNNAAAFFYYRTAAESGELEDQMLFRVRLDSKKNKMSGAYQVFFEINHDTSVDWVMQLTTSDLDTSAEVSFGSAAGTNRSAITFGSIVWANTNGYYNWTGVPTADGTTFNTDVDYFVDFGMPWSVFTNYTGITSTNDPFRFVISTSQSGGQIDDGDVGNSSAGLGVDVGFGDIFIDPDPEPGTYPQLINFPNPGHQYLTNAITLSANSDSGLPVDLTLVSGPAVLSSQSNLTFNGVGTVVVVATQDGDYTWKAAEPVTNIITVGKVPTAINVGDLNPVYDGMEKPVSVFTDPTGVVANVTYDGSPFAPTNAGTYTVVVSIDDPIYGGLQTNTLTIAKADQSIAFTNPGVQHLTNTVVLSAVADSGLPVSFSLDSGPTVLIGSTLTFTNSGTVVILADQAGDANWNAAAQTNVVFEVNNKAYASILLNGLSAIYDGTAKSVSSETSPAGLPIDITYDGSPNAPTNAGTYHVEAVINDAAYQGMTNAVFVIQKAAQILTFNPIADQVVTNIVNLSASTTGVGTPEFDVISGPASYHPAGPSLSFSDTGAVSVVAFETNSFNYAPVYVTNTFNVTRATAVIDITDLNPEYDGAAKSVTVATQPNGLPSTITYDGSPNAPTNAGSYEVIAVVDTPLYTGNVTNMLTISQASQVLTFNPIADQVVTNVVNLSASITGDGTPMFGVVSGPANYDPSGPSLNFSGTGTVSVVAFETNSVNYAPVYVTNTFNVTRATAVIDITDLNPEYDGTAKSVTVTTQPNGLPATITYDGSSNAPTNAGNYEVIVEVDTPLYIGAITNTLTIAATSQVLTFDPIADQIVTNITSLSASTTGDGSPEYEVLSGPGTLDPSGPSLSFSGTGTVSVVAFETNSVNFAPVYVTNTFNVTRATALIDITDLTPEYDGTAKSVTVTTQPNGLPATITYDGSSNAPTNAGTYEVIVEVDTPLYTGAVTNTLTISAATQNLTFDPIADQVVTNTVTLSAIPELEGSAGFEVISGPATLIAGPALSFNATGTVSVVSFVTNALNYGPVYVTNSFDVVRATPVIDVTDLTPPYDGTAKHVTVTTQPNGLPTTITYDGSPNAPTNAGSYEVIVIVDTPIYRGAVTNTLTIGGSVQVLTFDSIADQVVTNHVDLIASTTGDGTPEFEVLSGPATLEPSGPSLSFSATGTVSVVAFETNSVNYTPVYVTNTFNVTRATAVIDIADLTPAYDGTAKTANVTTQPNGLPTTTTYDGSSSAPTNAGSYEVIAVVDTPLYSGSATNTLVISQASQILTFDPIADQVTTDIVNLNAGTTGDGTPEFQVISGPASYDPSGPSLSFSGTGTVFVVAYETNSINYAPVYVTNTFRVSHAISADVSIILSGPTNGIAGLPMDFTLTIANSGPSAASNVVVQKELPTNQLFSVVQSAGLLTNNIVSWPAVLSLGAGEATNFTITVQPENPGVYSHAAAATSATYDPDPSNNSSTSALSRISVEVVAPAYDLFEGSIAMNPQTGLFEQHIIVTNTMTAAAPAFRVEVDGLRVGVTLWNATGTTNGVPYVQIDTPLNPGESLPLVLEYYVPDFQPVTSVLSVVWTLNNGVEVVAGAGASIGSFFMDVRDATAQRFVIEFETVPGETYTVLYSDDGMATWHGARPPISAGSTRTQWYDDGPPKTRSHPRDTTNRFYKVIQH